MSLSTKLRQLRDQKGWSQLDVAHQMDISQSAYNKWGSGQSKPTLPNLQKLSEIFEVDFYSLLNEVIPTMDFSNANFDGHSYVVSPIESTINFQSSDLIEKVVANQNDLSNQMRNQNKLLEILIKKINT